MLFSRKLDQLVPYVAGEQPQDKKYIKLNTNENPYPPCPGIRDYLKSMPVEDLKLYPDPDATGLVRTLADFHKVDPENIFTGNGSDEILSFVFFAFFDPAFPVLYPEYTYSFYPVYADFYGLSGKTVSMKKDLTFSLSDFLLDGNYSSIFPNPNAPTGICFSRKDISEFISKYNRNNPLVIDEAYIDFGGETVIPLIHDCHNLLIVRTMSKSAALAGMRIGYAVGNKKLIDALKIVKDSFNSYTLNRVSQECGRIAISEWAYHTDNIRRIIKTRDKFSNFLCEAGWTVLPSKANFVFARFPQKSGKEVYSLLKDNGILVRHFAKNGISDFLRITIGTDAEMETVTGFINKNLRIKP